MRAGKLDQMASPAHEIVVLPKDTSSYDGILSTHCCPVWKHYPPVAAELLKCYQWLPNWTVYFQNKEHLQGHLENTQ